MMEIGISADGLWAYFAADAGAPQEDVFCPACGAPLMLAQPSWYAPASFRHEGDEECGRIVSGAAHEVRGIIADVVAEEISEDWRRAFGSLFAEDINILVGSSDEPAVISGGLGDVSVTMDDQVIRLVVAVTAGQGADVVVPDPDGAIILGMNATGSKGKIFANFFSMKKSGDFFAFERYVSELARSLKFHVVDDGLWRKYRGTGFATNRLASEARAGRCERFGGSAISWTMKYGETPVNGFDTSNIDIWASVTGRTESEIAAIMAARNAQRDEERLQLARDHCAGCVHADPCPVFLNPLAACTMPEWQKQTAHEAAE